MKKFRNAVFVVFGIIGLIVQLLGLYIILILLGIITGAWVTLTTIGIVMTLVDLWKKSFFVKQGYKVNLLGYTKPKKDEDN